jgi:hypothetical protein
VKRTRILVVSTITVLALGASIYGMRLTLPNDKPVVRQERWPAGVAELASSRNRVKSYGHNFGTDAYYYAGDAKAFNAFLGEYAKLKGIPLLLTIHPGLGVKGRAAQTDPDVRFDWLLYVDALMRIGVVRKDPPPKCHPTLHLYLGDNIGLDEILVPLEVEVKSGGELEDFLSEHTAKRSMFPKESK